MPPREDLGARLHRLGAGVEQVLLVEQPEPERRVGRRARQVQRVQHHRDRRRTAEGRVHLRDELLDERREIGAGIGAEEQRLALARTTARSASPEAAASRPRRNRPEQAGSQQARRTRVACKPPSMSSGENDAPHRDGRQAPSGAEFGLGRSGFGGDRRSPASAEPRASRAVSDPDTHGETSVVDQFNDADVLKPVTDDMADAVVPGGQGAAGAVRTVGEARDAVVAEARDIGDEAACRLAEGAEGARDEAAAGLTAFSDALKAASSTAIGQAARLCRRRGPAGRRRAGEPRAFAAGQLAGRSPGDSCAFGGARTRSASSPDRSSPDLPSDGVAAAGTGTRRPRR